MIPREITIFGCTEEDITILNLWLRLELQHRNGETTVIFHDSVVMDNFFTLLTVLHLKGWGTPADSTD